MIICEAQQQSWLRGV